MKSRKPHSTATRQAISSSAKAAVARGKWPAPGPLWTRAEDAQLGTAPDSVIAARLRRSRGSVAARRHKLGIPSPAKAGRPHGWRKTPATDAK